MALGIDTATRLDNDSSKWNKFFAIRAGKQPIFAGRYFGETKHRWVPGELASLLAKYPSADSLKYILPIAPTGRITTERDNKYQFHFNSEGQPVQFDVQGETRMEGNPLRPNRVREQARKDANTTCEAIAAALDFIDPHTGQHELVLPDSGFVFVVLDIEPQTILNPYYWLGWAETVSSYPISKETAIGTLALVQPLRPCLYCVCNEDGPWNPEIKSAFSDEKVHPWNYRPWRYPQPIRLRGRHPCYALVALYFNDNTTFATAKTADDAKVQQIWKNFGVLKQPVGFPEAPVVIWQYFININMDASGNLFDGNYPGTPEGVLGIDFDATSGTYNGRPITDYMLRRP